MKFSSIEFEENVKSNRCLKSSLSSFSKLKNENYKSKYNDNNLINNTRNNSNKIKDFKESSSWASLKDYFCFQSQAESKSKSNLNKI